MLLLKSESLTSISSQDSLKMNALAIKPWLMAFRPKTLVAAVVPVAVGTALVAGLKFPIQWPMTIFALLGALWIQIGTNLINDAVDFKKGADGADRLGPQRVTQSGLLSGRAVMAAGFFCFFLALLCGIPLVLQGGWPLVLIGMSSLILGFAYTAGPWPLAYIGAGDLFVILFFGLVAVGGVFYLHTLTLHPAALIAGLQVGFLATVLIAINNLRDVNQDARANKKTLAVRFGKLFVRVEIAALSMLAFGLGVYWIIQGFLWVGVLPLLIWPLARRLLQRIFVEEPGPIYNRFLAQAALIQVLFGVLMTLGLVLT